MDSLGQGSAPERTGSHLVFMPGFVAQAGGAPDVYAAALLGVAARSDDAVAIDVQLPFCAMICSYCGSNATVSHDPREIDRYVDALVAETALVAEHLGAGREVVQLHFGGGTPNYLSLAQLTRIMQGLERCFSLLPETEATIDCDPRRASAAQLDGLRALGFGHVRFGMADLDPAVQRAAGRIQSGAMLRDVCALAVQGGFETVTVDMVYGLPGQSERSMRATLHELVDIGPDRIRCHPYLHRPAERRHQCALALEGLPDDAERAALFHAVADTLTQAGYTWIGLDHFVLDTDELAIAQAAGELHCNLIGYTARPRAHVIGLGAGATGEVGGLRVGNEPGRAVWQQRIAAGELPAAHAQPRSAAEREGGHAALRLLCDLALRTPRGTPGARAARARLAPFASRGWIEMHEDGVAVTPQGHFALEQLCAALQTPGAESASYDVRI